ncbi:MAG: biotin carboxylase N-terminal domain-containing protein, partial [Planctomycetota bacterium]
HVHIGSGPATQSYLSFDAILHAAAQTGATEIHPGYGFLSESAEFAERVADAGLTFVGPSADAMRRLGAKDAAKQVAREANVPIVPGYFDAAADHGTLSREARAIGFPLVVKAVSGGGGRGMRVVREADALPEALDGAAREARQAFGDDRLMLERLVERPRHIEVQVFGDTHGNVVHLFERDCTLQRRHQKVVEEAPAPGMSAELRAAMTEAAVRLAGHVGYTGAGTVEFLVEGGTLAADAPFYFIEMNTRLQVEHPVTEAITGFDLVEWQLRIAAGEKLPAAQAEISHRGHAIEVRLYAEDPENDFAPAVGTLDRLDLPEAARDVRIDTGFRTGDAVSPFYDAMLAKIITQGSDRSLALSTLTRALDEVVVFGLPTNTSFLARLLSEPDVETPDGSKADYDTGQIARVIDRLT